MRYVQPPTKEQHELLENMMKDDASFRARTRAHSLLLSAQSTPIKAIAKTYQVHRVTVAAWITNRQIEAARVAMTRHIKRSGKVWIRIFPDKPITSKPAETRMGKGKGNPEGWVAPVKPGRVLFELEGVPIELARRAMDLASAKLPVKTKFLVREE